MEEYLKQHYRQLVGFTVIDVEIVKTSRHHWPLLYLAHEDGRKLEVGVDADPEENGPGHLSIHPLIEPAVV